MEVVFGFKFKSNGGSDSQGEQYTEKELGPFQGLKECYSESIGMASQRSEGEKSPYTEPCSQLSISRLG